MTIGTPASRYSYWCEICRNHYPTDHFDEYKHKVGAEYGWHGAQLAVIEAAKAIAENPETWGLGYHVPTMHALREALAALEKEGP